MARKLRVVRNPGDLSTGNWIPTHAVRFNDDGTVSMMTENHRTANRGRRRRNVAAGFYEEETGIFHPIRSSYDYSRSRAGEPPLKRKKKAKAKKRSKPKARAKAKRRR